MNKKIAIIGMGHMGKALYEGLMASGLKNILVSNKSEENKKVAKDADWIIMAVKPKIVGEVIGEIKVALTNKIIISVAAGITTAAMQKDAANDKQKIIRLMPNLPVAFGQGVIGLYGNNNISDQEKAQVIKLFSQLGKVIDCTREEDLDVVTIIAGSGPAVVAYFISLLAQSGEKFGLEKNIAEQIALQTFVGTLAALQNTNQTANDLQTSVATKGGVTEEIIKNLDEEKIPSQFIESLGKGYAKIKKIGKT